MNPYRHFYLYMTRKERLTTTGIYIDICRSKSDEQIRTDEYEFKSDTNSPHAKRRKPHKSKAKHKRKEQNIQTRVLHLKKKS